MANGDSEQQFTVTYRGPAVELGRMSVQELAPSLIALSRALQETQRVTNPLGPEPALDIRAMRDGSFAVDLIVSEGGLVQTAIDFLAGRETTAAVNLAELVGVTFGGFALVRRLIRKIRKTDELEDGTVRITFGDGSTIVIPQDSLLIASNREFREAARDVMQPLSREGVDEVELSSPVTEPVVVQRDDLPSFDLPSIEEELLVDGERVVVLRPVSVAFAEGNKWRVSDGESIFWASLRDQAFLDRVTSGAESFTKSDILRARLLTRQFRDRDGDLRTEHEILEVLAHVPGPRDVPLPFEDVDVR